MFLPSIDVSLVSKYDNWSLIVHQSKKTILFVDSVRYTGMHSVAGKASLGDATLRQREWEI